MKRIVICGSGNAATFLSRALDHAGHSIIAVWSRSISGAELLAKHFPKCISTDDVNGVPTDADLYLIAVKDDAISVVSELLSEVLPSDRMLVHTSGFLPSTTISNYFTYRGTFYPLQSLHKEAKPHAFEIPICVYSKQADMLEALKLIAEAMSRLVYVITDEQKSTIHLAAVILNNFTNHLAAEAFSICDQAGVDREILHPLISETAYRIQHHNPSAIQTGPAIRGDVTVLSKHLELLNSNPTLRELYIQLSKAINPKLLLK